MAGPFQLGPQFPPAPPAPAEPPIPITNVKDFLTQKSAEADLSAIEKIAIGLIGVGIVELGLVSGGKGKVAKKLGAFAIKSGLELGIGAHALRPGNIGPGGHLNLPPGVPGGIESAQDRADDDARRRALAAQENATAGFLKSQQVGNPVIGLGPATGKKKLVDITQANLDATINILLSQSYLNPYQLNLLFKLLREQARRDQFKTDVFNLANDLLTGAGRLFPMWLADP